MSDPQTGWTADELRRSLAEDIEAINEIGDLTAWTHRMQDVPAPAEPRQQLDLSIFREVDHG